MMPKARPYCPSQRYRRGFSLTEIAIVLSVIILIISGIWIAASTASENYNQAQTASMVGMITNNMRAFKVGVPPIITTPPLENQQMMNALGLPSSYWDANSGRMTDAFGGTTHIQMVGGVPDAQIVFSSADGGGLTQQRCIRLLNTIINNSPSLYPRLRSIQINTNSPVANTATATNITTAALISECAAGTNNIVIEFAM